MREDFDKNRAGFALGILFAVMHFLWVIIVALGLGEGLFSWWRGVHFIDLSFNIASFSIVSAIIGIVGAFVTGYVSGWVLVWIYNKLG